MSRIHARIFIITSLAFAAVVVSAYWVDGVQNAADRENFSAGISLPGAKVMTTPLNAITSFDAAAVTRHVAGASSLVNINQFCAADVTNNGAISANDAAQISHYVAGVAPSALTGTVVPPPCHKNYPTSIAVLKGDVTGQDPIITGGHGSADVSLPAITATPGTIIIPVTVGDTTSLDIFSYDFQVTFDPAVVQPAPTFIDQTGTLSSSMPITANASNPGHLIVSAFTNGLGPLTGSGILLKLRFNIVGSAEQSTALTFEDYTDPNPRIHQGFLFNEGTPAAITTNGSVTVPAFPTFTPTSTPTSTFTPSNTATPSATNTPLSTLGNYTDKITRLSNDETVAPDAPPTNTTRINVFTDTNFKGTLEGDPATGVVRITDAHPDGTYLITVRAFDSNGNDAVKTFTLTVTTVLACNPVSFAPAAFFSTSPSVQPYRIAIGDFNRDGKQDIVTANSEVSQATVLLGNGMGQFGPVTIFDTGGVPNSLAIGDFNGDGKQDLAVATDAAVSILLGNGAGGFGAATSYPAHNGSFYVVVGDFNRDGKQDLAVTNENSNDLSVLLGNGLGGFGAPSNFATGPDPIYVALGDFNGDGNPDVVSANNDHAGPLGGYSILLGNGAGGFGPAANINSSGASTVTVADVNGDHKQDLILSGGGTSIRLGDGAGGFTGVSSLQAQGDPNVGDFNGDGKPDIATAGGATGGNVGGGVVIYPGDGAGGFASGTVFPTGTATYQGPLAVGDFDGDGEQDIVLVDRNADNNGVWVFLRDCSGVPNIRGTLAYGNPIGSPSTRHVSNVMMAGSGSPGVSTATDSLGNYTLAGFGAGAYTVTPTKTGGINNSITSFDAARIAQHTTGTVLLNANQLAVADVSGNGTVSSFDAAQIARYVASLPPFGVSGTWKFLPANRTYSSVANTLSGEDYTALLMGEVSGNWTNTGARQAIGPERSVSVSLPKIEAFPEKEIVVPVTVESVKNKGVISYELDLKYDPSVIQPAASAADLAGTVSRGLVVVSNPLEPGLLRVVVYGAMPISDDGVLLNLRFTAVGKPGSITPLTFERLMFNEGEPRVNATAGEVELF
jgi:hypothetical protein